MQCVKCKYPTTYTLRTISDNQKDYVKRRRECPKCGHRFNTEEKNQPIKFIDGGVKK